ncbi:glycosyltransferase, partial [Actinomadura sp. 7K507]|uniref:glycosyltransferase n=1 Tax=Actinomadura sp. 7K507 TaxID=2530365 RepID=UPI0010E16B15
MARFLFVSWGGAGNQTPVFGLAAALAARGHDVTVAGYPEQRDRFESLGFEFRALPRAQHAWPATPPEDWMPVLVDAVWACPAHLEDIPGLVAGKRYDLLVIDCLMFAALAAAETTGVPAVALVHSAPGALAPPGGGLDQLVLPRVNAVRARAGLTPLSALWDAWRPFTALVTSVPDLDPCNGGLPDAFAFMGPVFEPPREPRWTSPWAAGDHRPLVVASFSTGQAWDQSSRIRRTRDALADGRHRVLITTGPFAVDPMPDRPGVSMAPFVPHHAVLGVRRSRAENTTAGGEHDRGRRTRPWAANSTVGGELDRGRRTRPWAAGRVGRRVGDVPFGGRLPPWTRAVSGGGDRQGEG